MNIDWGEVTVYLNDTKFTYKVFVLKITEEIYEGYWVRCGGLIDVTVRKQYGKKIVGIGAKKYERKIGEAIAKFEAEKFNDRIKEIYDKVLGKPCLKLIKTDKEG